MEPRVRRAASRAGLTELTERVARLETTVEHLQATLTRIKAGMSKIKVKLDGLADARPRASAACAWAC